jgi:hypothetical protein
MKAPSKDKHNSASLNIYIEKSNEFKAANRLSRIYLILLKYQ